MKKNGRSRFQRKMILGTAVVLILSVILTGCGARKYQRITIEDPAQEESSGRTEIRIGDDGAAMPPDSGIVIEQETEQEADQLLGQPTDQAEQDRGMGLGVDGRPDGAGGNTLLFGGDVLLSSHVLNAYQKAGGIHGVLDEGYQNVIRDADFFMVNQEFPFSSRGVQAEDKEYTFRLEPERVSMFRELGIDAVTLANNHALDFGEEALLDSIAALDGAGILHTGAGVDLAEAKKPVETELDGIPVAVIGATRVIPVWSWAAGKNHAGMLSSYDATALLKEIQDQKERGKFVIVYVHWGVEKDEKPQEYQRTLGQQYIDAGADLVIGAHPHVLQGLEYYKGKPIVYSLGNFVFGSSIPRTMLLEVTLSKPGDSEAGGDPVVGLRLIPGTSGAGYTRRITDAVKLREFYQYMESISFGVGYGEDGTVIPR